MGIFPAILTFPTLRFAPSTQSQKLAQTPSKHLLKPKQKGTELLGRQIKVHIGGWSRARSGVEGGTSNATGGAPVGWARGEGPLPTPPAHPVGEGPPLTSPISRPSWGAAGALQ